MGDTLTARRLVIVEVTWNAQTYIGKIYEGRKVICRCTCTSGQEQAARACAAKHFGCPRNEVELKKIGGGASMSARQQFDAWHPVQVPISKEVSHTHTP